MKKIIICVVLFILIMSFVGCAGSYNPTLEKSSVTQLPQNSVETLGGIAKDKMSTLATEFPNRTSGEGNNSYLFAKKISTDMTTLGYGYKEGMDEEKTKGVTTFKFKSPIDNKDYEGYNAFFDLSAKSEVSKGKIVFACYYDNNYSVKVGEKLLEADGSYESGASIAVMFTLAEYFIANPIDYDITFAFFDAGTFGYKGAYEYTKKMTAEEKNAISLFINFSHIIGGDNLYAFSRDKAVDYNGFTYAVAKANELNLTKVPSNKRVKLASLDENSPYPYFHMGMLGNHLPIMYNKIPSINYISANWETNQNPGMTESKGKQNIIETSEDTFAKMIERFGEDKIKERLGEIVALNIAMLSTPEYMATFDNAMTNARKQEVNFSAIAPKTSNLITIIMVVALVAGIMAVSMAVKNSIQKNKSQYKIIDPLQQVLKNMPNIDEEADIFGEQFSSPKPKVDTLPKDDDDVFEGF